MDREVRRRVNAYSDHDLAQLTPGTRVAYKLNGAMVEGAITRLSGSAGSVDERTVWVVDVGGLRELDHFGFDLYLVERSEDEDDDDHGMLARFARLHEGGRGEMGVEDEERRAAGGRMLCPQCEQRSVVESFGDTGEYDSFVECETPDCGFLEIFF